MAAFYASRAHADLASLYESVKTTTEFSGNHENDLQDLERKYRLKLANQDDAHRIGLDRLFLCHESMILYLKYLCRELDVSLPCANTAAIYAKRLYAKQSMRDFHPLWFLPVCLFLACKAEEQPMQSTKVANAANASWLRTFSEQVLVACIAHIILSESDLNREHLPVLYDYALRRKEVLSKLEATQSVTTSKRRKNDSSKAFDSGPSAKDTAALRSSIALKVASLVVDLLEEDDRIKKIKQEKLPLPHQPEGFAIENVVDFGGITSAMIQYGEQRLIHSLNFQLLCHHGHHDLVEIFHIFKFNTEQRGTLFTTYNDAYRTNLPFELDPHAMAVGSTCFAMQRHPAVFISPTHGMELASACGEKKSVEKAMADFLSNRMTTIAGSVDPGLIRLFIQQMEKLYASPEAPRTHALFETLYSYALDYFRWRFRLKRVVEKDPVKVNDSIFGSLIGVNHVDSIEQGGKSVAQNDLATTANLVLDRKPSSQSVDERAKFTPTKADKRAVQGLPKRKNKASYEKDCVVSELKYSLFENDNRVSEPKQASALNKNGTPGRGFVGTKRKEQDAKAAESTLAAFEKETSSPESGYAVQGFTVRLPMKKPENKDDPVIDQPPVQVGPLAEHTGVLETRIEPAKARSQEPVHREEEARPPILASMTQLDDKKSENPWPSPYKVAKDRKRSAVPVDIKNSVARMVHMDRQMPSQENAGFRKVGSRLVTSRTAMAVEYHRSVKNLERSQATRDAANRDEKEAPLNGSAELVTAMTDKTNSGAVTSVFAGEPARLHPRFEASKSPSLVEGQGGDTNVVCGDPVKNVLDRSMQGSQEPKQPLVGSVASANTLAKFGALKDETVPEPDVTASKKRRGGRVSLRELAKMAISPLPEGPGVPQARVTRAASGHALEIKPCDIVPMPSITASQGNNKVAEHAISPEDAPSIPNRIRKNQGNGIAGVHPVNTSRLAMKNGKPAIGVQPTIQKRSVRKRT